MTDTLPVIELFGPTIQGEGPAAGRAAAFVRFAGCNLSCSWCDTAYSWQPGAVRDARQMTVPAIREQLPDRIPVVLTGGEPLLQQQRPAWPLLMSALAPRRVWIETNGTVVPEPCTLRAADLIVVSPKRGNAGPHRGRQHPAIRQAWRDLATTNDRVHGKYVVATPDDIADALSHANSFGLSPQRTWLMPQAVTPEAHAALWRDVAEQAAAAGVNATPRLHVLAWGTERGR